MKHLKTWEQINELHSDTYRSAAMKHYKKMGIEDSTYRNFNDMYFKRKAEEDGRLYYSEKDIKNMARKKFKELSHTVPEKLKQFDITSWREIIYILNSLNDDDFIDLPGKYLSVSFGEFIMDYLLDIIKHGQSIANIIEEYFLKDDNPEVIKKLVENGYDINDFKNYNAFNDLLKTTISYPSPNMSRYILDELGGTEEFKQNPRDFLYNIFFEELPPIKVENFRSKFEEIMKSPTLQKATDRTYEELVDYYLDI